MTTENPQSPSPISPPPPAETPAPKLTLKQKIWTVIDIISVRLRFVLLMVIVGVVAAKWDTIMNYYDRYTRPAQSADQVVNADIEYYCGMHPNIHSDHPGKCPICGMPLIQRAKSHTQGNLPEGVLAQVQLTPQKVEMGRIGTSPVEYRLLTREVRTVGTVDYNETLRATITSRLKGRLDKLLINFIGQKVKKGDPLAEIYSPDLLVAQEELLGAVRTQKEQTTDSLAAESAKVVVEAARRKLSLWGVTEQQIDEVIRQNTPQTHLTIYSPIAGIVTEKKVLEGKYVMEGEELYTIADLGNVWMQAKIFESDIQGITEGTVVEVTTTAYPNEIFAGRIAFIAYTVEPETRTVAARVEILNPGYKLKPGMFVNAIIRLPLGKIVELAGPTTQPVQPVATSLPAGLSTYDLLQAYFPLSAALAQDKTDPAALAKLQAEVDKLVALAPELKEAVAVATQAKAMSGQSLDAQRETFKTLSTNLITLARLAPPTNTTFNIAHCPMANADWITATKEIVNPYKGADMLTCGSITGPLLVPNPPASTTTDSDRFVTGYYCPVYPDRLYDQPESCPMDMFPLKYVRIEKVPAIPEAAIIDSGTRKIAYRETIPQSGTFDMVEVQVGPRAGEFYPLISGLKPGDLVATQGAFLVDAENRLNPAASAQFFGASNPQTGDHKP